jgi:predicted amidophosphoribosyltransferase
VCRTTLSDGRALCAACDADLPRLAEPFCKSCGESFPGEIEGTFACPNCHQLKFAFEFARPAMVRDDRTLEMIHRLKYSRELHLAKDLGRLAAGSFGDPRLAPALASAAGPRPAASQANTAISTAEEIQGCRQPHRLPVVKALQRPAPPAIRPHLPAPNAWKTLRGAAHPRRHPSTNPAGVLVDDVLTTGSPSMNARKAPRRVPASLRGHRDARLTDRPFRFGAQGKMADHGG